MNAPFPSMVQGSGPIVLSKLNGIWTVGLTASALAVQNPPPQNLPTDQAIVWDSINKQWILVPLTAIAGSTSTLAYSASVVGATVSNSNVATALKTFNQINANTLQVGSVIRLRGGGLYSTAAAAPGLTLAMAIAGVTFAYSTTTMPASQANVGWGFEADIVMRAIGAGGNAVVGFASVMILGAPFFPGVNPAVPPPQALNTTVPLSVALFAQWSVANAANSITLDTMTVEVINPVSTS
jgi:hypothetical protein